jgi:hypothetical protein
MQRQREKSITEPVRDYNNNESKNPYYVNYNKPPSSQNILPQSTKSTDLRKSLLGFSNTFFNNVCNKNYNGKETTPLLHDKSIRTRESSINPAELSTDHKENFNRKLSKEEAKNKDDYYFLNSNHLKTPNNNINFNCFHIDKTTKRNSLIKTPIGTYVNRFTENDKNKPNEHVNISSLLNQQHIPLDTNVLKENFAGYENSKFSTKSTSCIKAYCANTHQGIVR